MKSKLAAILAVAVLSSGTLVFAQDVVHDVDKGAKDVGHDTKVAAKDTAHARIRRQKIRVTPPR